MGIKIEDIEVGYEYETPEKQDRVVLAFTGEDKVIYASRGGNVKNPYNQKIECQKERFAKACAKKKNKIRQDVLTKISEALGLKI